MCLTRKLKNKCGRESGEIVRGDSSVGDKNTLSPGLTCKDSRVVPMPLSPTVRDSETGRGVPGACCLLSLACSMNSRPRRELISRKSWIVSEKWCSICPLTSESTKHTGGWTHIHTHTHTQPICVRKCACICVWQNWLNETFVGQFHHHTWRLQRSCPSTYMNSYIKRDNPTRHGSYCC